MIVSMAISLYTSRVILDVLGVVDFGIYNIIGSIVVLFTFISSSLNSATQRYLNVAMGKEDVSLVKNVFSNSLIIYIVLAFFIGIVAELFGWWFIQNKLNIPLERLDAAIFVFHFSVLTFCLNILRIPYNAVIIANEKMSFYAYGTLVENGLKLIVVWLLLIFAYDKLKLYSIMIFLVTGIILWWYILYCRKKFPFYKFKFKINKQLIKEMMSFSGWNLFGGIADIGFSQGTNMILNIFHGVTLNAALGLANQVKAAICSFVSNLQVAANPQIIKSYAGRDMLHFSELIYAISKFSFYLMLLIALPCLCNINYILNLWLVEVPDHTANFLVLTIILAMFNSLHGPLWTGMQANGNLKQYQIVISCFLLLNLPFTYITLQCGFPPESIIVVQIALNIVVLVVRLLYAKTKCSISLRFYTVKVIRPVLAIVVITVPVILFIASSMEDGFLKLLSTTCFSVFVTAIAIYYIGVSAKERTIFKIAISKVLHRSHNLWKRKKY